MAMFTEIEIKNTVFDETLESKPVFNPKYEPKEGSLLERLHNSRGSIQEKAYGNISAFNFTRDVFNKGDWNSLTTKARGLFLDNQTGEIVARGFEKFFGYRERQFNSDEFLRESLAYPVVAYRKYNGFLGILGYNADGLLFCSKSTVGGDYADIFKRIFFKHGHDVDGLLAYMRERHVGLVFEVIDPVNDPHIVEYPDERIVLLDAISLEEEFRDIPFEELDRIAHQFNFMVKQIVRVFEDWESLQGFLKEVDGDGTTEDEGCVVVDAKGYQFKLKGAWYRKWKMLRSFKDKIARGHLVDIAGISDPESIAFIGWAKRKGAEYCERNSIIQMRKEFAKEQKNG